MWSQVIYLDLDTLWLDDPRELWSHFDALNAKGAFFGAVEEAREGGWYAGNKPGGEMQCLHQQVEQSPAAPACLVQRSRSWQHSAHVLVCSYRACT